MSYAEDLPHSASAEYRVTFLGGVGVGKTSIIDQFMSSDHTDVFENNQHCENKNHKR